PFVVVVDIGVVQAQRVPESVTPRDGHGGLDPMLNPAGTDEMDRSNHIRDRSAVEIRTVYAGGEHAGAGLAARTSQGWHRQAAAVEDINQIDDGYSCFEVQ